MIVGLTGGIGSGKSAAAKIFVELGIDVIDADELSKNVLIENQKAKKIFVEKFGQKYINSNDEIDRELLREDIFKDEEKRKDLEGIIHPIVREEISKFVVNSKSIYKIIMVPLILETNSVDAYEKIVVVDCDLDKQIERASRDDVSKENVENIIKNQASREERLSIADQVIMNNASLDDLRLEVIKVHQKLIGLKIDE